MNQKIYRIIPCLMLLTCSIMSTHAFADVVAKLQAAAQGSHRSAENIARNAYRHPVQTLQFFGINEAMTVVELSPGGGWYTEILAPYLREKGHFIAAGYDPNSSDKYYRNNALKFQKKLVAVPNIYDKTEVTIMTPGKKLDFAKPGTADMILSFRNAHGWQRDNYISDILDAVFSVLKPGGIFGIVQHRADLDQPKDQTGKQGYLSQDGLIDVIKKAGFKLLAHSEINANPKDSKDHANGVWSLPPVLAEKDESKAHYLAVGESDRMTLKFIKPSHTME